MRRRRGHSKQILLLLLSIEVLLIVGLLAYIQLRPMVVEAVTMEAGDIKLEVDDFLIYKNRKGSFFTDIQKLNYRQPGTYEIKIKIGSRLHTSSLVIEDTIAPTAQATNLWVLREEKLEAADFITELKDATDVKISYSKEPDTSKLGEQEVSLALTDESGNRVTLHAVLTVLDIRNSVSIEAGSFMDITVNDFLDNNKYKVAFVTDLNTLDISKPTVHTIVINVDGRNVFGSIEVVDTKAPLASFANREVWKGESIPANSFVSRIEDVSEVSVSYKTEPDFEKVGKQSLGIILEDAYGNTTEQQVMLTVKADTEPPKIMGTRDKTVYIGDGVAYRKGVYVTDNKDADLSVEVDNSNVNLKKEGVYTVIYKAKDLSGNQARVEATVTVIKFVVTEDMVYDMADDVLAKIIKPSMTKKEMAQEIYSWIKKNVGYVSTSDKTDWLAEAYRAMEDREGDCFTFYAVAQALLTRAGIDNMRVTRVGGRTQHFWNLVNSGDGWYHFDSCPNRDKGETFMLTDQELEEYAKTRGSYYYNYDKTLYPATPEK